ncbi:MAG: hypothetical protein PUC23_03220 [bacterium]|nr:hypothetical protein [bacterium]
MEEMDLNDVLGKLNELENERQAILKNINNLMAEIDNTSLKENNDVFLDLESREKAMKEVNKKIRLAKKEQAKYDLIFDRQLELVKERDVLVNKNFEIITNINNVNSEISVIDGRITTLDEEINRLIMLGVSQEAVAALNKEKETLQKDKAEKLAKIEELNYQKEIIFDKSKRRKEEAENKDEISEEQRENVYKQFDDLAPVVDPNEQVVPVENKETKEEPEVEEKKVEIKDSEPTKSNNKLENAANAIKNGAIDVKNEAENLMKKRPKLIKNIAGWVKSHPTAIALAAGAIAISLMAGGAVAALAATAGEAASAYVAYKSTLGKGK